MLFNMLEDKVLTDSERNHVRLFHGTSMSQLDINEF